jgi:beta-galactosidase
MPGADREQARRTFSELKRIARLTAASMCRSTLSPRGTTPWCRSARCFPYEGGYPDAPVGRLACPMAAGGGLCLSPAQQGCGQHCAWRGRPSFGVRFHFSRPNWADGIEDTYHRRPVIQPDDVAAIVPVMLGSGVNLFGTYMFQGGENPDGQRSTLEESQATGYPNDVPVKSYDFQAPLGEFGQERAVLPQAEGLQLFSQRLRLRCSRP